MERGEGRGESGECRVESGEWRVVESESRESSEVRGDIQYWQHTSVSCVLAAMEVQQVHMKFSSSLFGIKT